MGAPKTPWSRVKFVKNCGMQTHDQRREDGESFQFTRSRPANPTPNRLPIPPRTPPLFRPMSLIRLCTATVHREIGRPVHRATTMMAVVVVVAMMMMMMMMMMSSHTRGRRPTNRFARLPLPLGENANSLQEANQPDANNVMWW